MHHFPFLVPALPGCRKRIACRRGQGLTALLWSIVLLPALAAAQPPLSLAEAVRLAVARSGAIASQQSMAAAAREMSVAAGELPDPKLFGGFENVPAEGADAWRLNRDGMTMTRIGVMQDFPREEKRRLRTERAVRDAVRSDAAAASAAAGVRRDTASAWFARRYAEDAERAIAAQIAEAELAVVAAGAAYRANKAPQAELLMAQSLVVELANRATEAKAQSRRARIALARYVGADSERALGEAPDLARLPADFAELADVDAQAEVRAARAQEAYLATEAELARAGRLPDWNAELSYGIRGSGFPNMVSLMVSIDLPWSPGTRQDREHAAKLKELDAARAMRDDTHRMRTAEVQSMLAEWESAHTQAQRMRTELLPLNALRRESALAAYRGGTGTLTAVLEARRAELETTLSLLQMEQAAAKAWAYLTYVLPVAEPA
jgi:outer membrane protein TolC